MTTALDHATLAEVDEDTRAQLGAAAAAYKQAPAALKAAIRAAADKGDRPADIVKAIGHVWTYDYVARLVREHRRGATADT